MRPTIELGGRPVWQKHYEHYVKSVMKSGEPAQAEVISAEPGLGNPGVHKRIGEASWGWNVHLRVLPQDGEPFELRCKMEIPVLMDPVMGTKLQVFYNPRKPESIVVDPASEPRDKTEAVVTAAVDIQGMLGADTTGMKEAAAGIADPIEAAEAASAQAARNLVANRDAMHAEVERVRAEQGEEAAAKLVAANNQAAIGQVFQAFSKLGITPPALGSPGASPHPPADVQAQLEQLKRLNAAGALNDEEYKLARERVTENS